MDEIVLKLGKKSFKLKFGLKLFRILGRKWELPGIDEVVTKMAVLDSVDGKLTFDQIDVLEQILVSAIECGGEIIDLTKYDIIDEFFKNPKALDDFKEALISSLPKNEPQDNEENSGK
jgi:hypothetical protein